MSDGAAQVLSKILLVDPNKRMTAAQILDLPWVAEGVMKVTATKPLPPTIAHTHSQHIKMEGYTELVTPRGLTSYNLVATHDREDYRNVQMGNMSPKVVDLGSQ